MKVKIKLLFLILFGSLQSLLIAQKRFIIANKEKENLARVENQLSKFKNKPNKIYYYSSYLSYADAACLNIAPLLPDSFLNTILKNIGLINTKNLNLKTGLYNGLPITFFGYEFIRSAENIITYIDALTPKSYPLKYAIFFDAIKSYKNKLQLKSNTKIDFDLLSNYFDSIKTELKPIYGSNFNTICELWQSNKKLPANKQIEIITSCSTSLFTDTASVVILELNENNFFKIQTANNLNIISPLNLIQLVKSQNELNDIAISIFQNPKIVFDLLVYFLNTKQVVADSVFGNSPTKNIFYTKPNYLLSKNKQIKQFALIFGNTFLFLPKSDQNFTRNDITITTLGLHYIKPNIQFGFTYGFATNLISFLSSPYSLVSIQNYEYNQRYTLKKVQLGKVAKLNILLGTSIYYSSLKLKNNLKLDVPIQNPLAIRDIYKQQGTGFIFDIGTRINVRELVYIYIGVGVQTSRFNNTKWELNRFYYPGIPNFKFQNFNTQFNLGFLI